MMSSESYRQVLVRCPFYHRDNGRSTITCEGIVEGSTLSLNFPNKQEFLTQSDVFCCDYYKNCEVYRMLMDARYDEDES